jgi:hypothetical protein
VLYLTLIDSGADLVVSAGSEVYELASDLPTMTPVGFNVAIDGTRTHGAVARLRAVSLEAVIDGQRLEASDADWDTGTKAVRKKLSAYAKSISH